MARKADNSQGGPDDPQEAAVEVPPILRKKDNTLNVDWVPIDSIILDAANTRFHDEQDIQFKMGILRRFGWQKVSITLDPNMVARAGNGLVIAAKRLGCTEVPVQRSELKGTEATAFSIVDNRSAETSRWDFPVLGETFKSLQEEGFDLGELGFGPDDIAGVFADLPADRPEDPTLIGAHDPASETAVIKVEVPRSRKDELLKMVNDALEGTDYVAVAY